MAVVHRASLPKGPTHTSAPPPVSTPHYTVFTPAIFITQGAEQSTSKAEGVLRTTRKAACVLGSDETVL